MWGAVGSAGHVHSTFPERATRQGPASWLQEKRGLAIGLEALRPLFSAAAPSYLTSALTAPSISQSIHLAIKPPVLPLTFASHATPLCQASPMAPQRPEIRAQTAFATAARSMSHLQSSAMANQQADVCGGELTDVSAGLSWAHNMK